MTPPPLVNHRGNLFFHHFVFIFLGFILHLGMYGYVYWIKSLLEQRKSIQVIVSLK
jgi:hypothetical protein